MDTIPIEIIRRRISKVSMWLIFIVMPFVAFLISIRSYPSGRYKLFILLFFVLYGFTYLPIPNSDSTRYVKYYEQYSTYNYDDFKQIISNTYTARSLNPDFYAASLLFLTSRISSDPRLFFLIQALIYYSVCLALWNTIWRLNKGNHQKFYTLFFIGTIFIINISAGLNGVRWPLAFMVFSFGALKYILTQKFRFLGLAIASVFIHFSFIPTILFLLGFSVLKSVKNINLVISILIIIAIASSFLSVLLESGAHLLGPGISNKLQGFSNEEFHSSREAHVSTKNWYIQFSRLSTIIFIIVSMALLWIRKSKLKFDETSTSLFIFTIILLIQSILTSYFFDSITNDRYFMFMTLFGLITLYYTGYINQHSVLIKTLSFIYLPILILHILIVFRGDLYTVSPILVFGNIFLIIFTKTDINIQHFLGL